MTQAMAKRSFIVFASILAVAFVCLSAGCGGEGAAPDEAFTSSESLGDLDPVESLIFSEEYAGYLVVHVDESLGVRVNVSTKSLTSKLSSYEAIELLSYEDIRKKLEEIQKTIEAHPLAALNRVIKASPEAADKRRAELEKLSGKKLADMNSIFRIDIADPAEAVKLYRELKNLEGVESVYPYPVAHPMSIEDVPDLTPYQGYLNDLNAQAAWNDGIKGEGVFVVDSETDWNFAHEDLPIYDADPTDEYIWRLIGAINCEYPEQRPFCPGAINHGTGMVGIIGANENEHGTTGFAPVANTYVSIGQGGDLLSWTDGEGERLLDELPPGTVFVMATGFTGPLGGLPMEVTRFNFAGISQATAAGLTVIEAAGNSNLDLVTAAAYPPPYDANVSLLNDSGAIIVGASWGATLEGAPYYIPNRTKRVDSNCGARINSFAWGHNVVTTGFQHPSHPYVWDPNLLPDHFSFPRNENGNFFINNFGGTSAATAMVAGAAALIQSYAKRELAEIAGDPALAATRYLMPLKMREILMNSGLSQVDGGCNIGKQPDVGAAMRLVDVFVSSVVTTYPEIASGETMTAERMIAMRQAGVGVICRFRNPAGSDSVCPTEYRCVPADPEHSDLDCPYEYRCRPYRDGWSDSDCPENYIWPPNTGIAKDMDFDGDGRADLVQWTNGTWKLDLSSRGDGGDNFGSWDVEISHPPVVPTPMPSEDDGRMMAVPPGEWVWPYVNDMNSDGRTDFVVYNRWNGEWLISYTDTSLIAHADWRGWDRIIVYSNEWHDELKLDPLSCTTGTGRNCANYSRPAIGDYDGDGQNDIAIAASDGNWYISHDWREHDGTGHYDQVVRYLSDEQLAAAPGWAYLPAGYPMRGVMPLGMYLGFKIPDGLPDEGRFIALAQPPYETFDLMEMSPHIFGGNEDIILPARYHVEEGIFYPEWAVASLGVKKNDGTWSIAFVDDSGDYYLWRELLPVSPSNIFGDSSCHPNAADFDGDNQMDRMVMCPDEWRIAYSSNDLFTASRDTDGARRISLDYDTDVFSLPGRSYSGGISYESVRRLIEFFRRVNPTIPPPIPVDMP